MPLRRLGHRHALVPAGSVLKHGARLVKGAKGGLSFRFSGRSDGYSHGMGMGAGFPLSALGQRKGGERSLLVYDGTEGHEV